MNRLEPKGRLERGAASDLWRNTLSQVPTVFGRLAYLSGLRDPNTARYQHCGLAQTFGQEEAERVLRESHEQSFSDWLCFTLEQQKADLDLYLASLNGTRKTIVETWIRLAPYRSLVPSAAREVERQLYEADLEAILELLKAECGAASPDPDA